MDTTQAHVRTTLTLIAAYLGLFVGLIDANAVNLALPAIRDDLGGGISGAQWTIDAYNITFAALLLTSGSLGDRFGRRKLLRVGLRDVRRRLAGLCGGAVPSAAAGRTRDSGCRRRVDAAAGAGHHGRRVSRTRSSEAGRRRRGPWPPR